MAGFRRGGCRGGKTFPSSRSERPVSIGPARGRARAARASAGASSSGTRSPRRALVIA